MKRTKRDAEWFARAEQDRAGCSDIVKAEVVSTGLGYRYPEAKEGHEAGPLAGKEAHSHEVWFTLANGKRVARTDYIGSLKEYK